VNRAALLKRILVLCLLAACGVVGSALFLIARSHDEVPPQAEPASVFERTDRALAGAFERLEAGIRLTDDDKRFLLGAARRVLENRFATPREKLDRAEWSGVPPNVASQEARVFVTLIAGGKTRGCQSGAAGDLLARTIEGTREAVVDARFGGSLRADELPKTRIDLQLLLDPEEVTVRAPALLAREIELGIHALGLDRAGRRAFFKSSVPVAHGYDLAMVLQRLERKAGLGAGAWRDRGTRIRRYPTVHFAEHPEDGTLLKVYRYNTLFPQAAVTREACIEMLRRCGDYVTAHVDDEGLLTYIYNVYRDRRDDPDTGVALIRRLAGTSILAELGRFFEDAAYTAAAKRSIDYSLAKYYRDDAEQGFAYLQVGEDATLAPAAFVVLSLVAMDRPEFRAREKAALLRFLLAMEDREKGFLYPAYLPDKLTGFERKEIYYPGEALTALMAAYERTAAPELLAVAERVFPYYRGLFDRASKKASLAPWMSKAYTAAFLATGERKYAEFVLRMNDYLATCQQGPDAKYPDKIGSFFSSGSSCSAGVFVEGLVEAYRVAEALGDEDRMRTYRDAVLLGLRFLLQCQYRPENLFTAPNPSRASGGVRTSVYDTSVRIDAMQHAACAALRAVQYVPLPAATSR